MQKVVEIEEGRSFTFKATAFTPIQYHLLFSNHDFFPDVNALQTLKDIDSLRTEEYEILARLAYTMIYQGLAPTPKETEEQKEFRQKYDSLWSFADDFNIFSLVSVLDEVLGIWNSSEGTGNVKEKNLESPPPES